MLLPMQNAAVAVAVAITVAAVVVVVAHGVPAVAVAVVIPTHRLLALHILSQRQTIVLPRELLKRDMLLVLH
jgi:hypothetical protein